MSTSQIVYLRGIARWAQVHKPNQKYNKFSVEINLDEPSMVIFKTLKLKNRPKVDPDGTEWVTFRSDPEVFGKPFKPFVKNEQGGDVTDPIGNGSEITVKLERYSGTGAHGEYVGSRIQGIQVNTLVKYVKPEPDSGTAPASIPARPSSPSPMPF